MITCKVPPHSNWRFIGLFGVFLLLFTAPFVYAQNIVTDTECTTYDLQDNQASATVSLPRFDPALGTLQSVKITMQMDTEHTVGIENESPSEATVEAGVRTDAFLTLPQRTPANQLQTDAKIPPDPNQTSITLASYDGVTDFAGVSGVYYNALMGTGGFFDTNKKEVTYNPAEFSYFVGTTDFDIPLSTNATFYFRGGAGNLRSDIGTVGEIKVCVVYTYLHESDLELDIDVDQPQVPHLGTVNYTLTLTNKGPAATSNVTVDYKLPAGLIFSQSDSPNYDPNTNTWTVGDLAVNETVTLVVTATVDQPSGGTITSSTEVYSSAVPDIDSTPQNNIPAEDDQDSVPIEVIITSNIGDYVWYDDNRDTVQDNNEIGVPNVTVELYNDQGQLVTSTLTDADGLYLFKDIVFGDYTVKVDTLTFPANHLPTTPIEHSLTLNPGEDYLDADFGIAAKYGSIGDYVWWDKDEDGEQDAGEPGLPNITLYLTNSNGDTIQTQVTDQNGYYLFNHTLEPDDYYVYIAEDDAPNGLVLSTNTNPTAVIHLHWSEFYKDADFGFTSVRGVVGDFVWYDTNRDGIQDDNEEGIEGIILFLETPQGDRIAKTITDEDGKYLFKNVAPGDYVVRVDENSVPPRYSATTPQPHSLTMNEKDIYLLADFGYWSPAAEFLQGGHLLTAWYINPLQQLTNTTMETNPVPYHNNDIFSLTDEFVDARLEYDILQAWTAGIDAFIVEWFGNEGAVLNNSTTRLLEILDKADELNKKYAAFGFDFRIMTAIQEDYVGTLDENLQFAADSVLSHPAYFSGVSGYTKPVFFFNKYLNIFEPETIREKADAILPESAILAWNEGYDLSVFEHMDLLYPWIQPMDKGYDKENGLLWGDRYLDFEYTNMNTLPDTADVLFAIGTPWPGKSEMASDNTERLWINPQDTLVYENTWEKLLGYSGYKPMGLVIVETWNDLDEQSDILPTLENRYKFLLMTAKYASSFKNTNAHAGDNHLAFIVPQKLRQLRIAAKQNPAFAWQFKFAELRAMENFFEADFYEAVSILDQALGLSPKAVEIGTLDGNSVELSWTAAPRASRYVVSFATDSSRFNVNSRLWPEMVTVSTNSNAVITGLQPLTTYYMAVTPADSSIDYFSNNAWYSNQFSNGGVFKFTTLVGQEPQEEEDPDDPNAPQYSDNSLAFVSGSPTYRKGTLSYGWENAVDGDLEGWDGTVHACGEANISDPAWGIFKFADDCTYKFNYVTLVTDNGAADDGNKGKFDYQTTEFEVLVSTTDTNPENFSSVGVFKRKNAGTLAYFSIGEYVEAKYIMLRLLQPNYRAWRQIVEFNVTTENKKGAEPTADNDALVVLPEKLELCQNFPNPFNPTTQISFALPKASDVTLNVYNITGKLVASLANGYYAAGNFTVTFDAGNLASGVYWYQLQSDGHVLTRKMLLTK